MSPAGGIRNAANIPARTLLRLTTRDHEQVPALTRKVDTSDDSRITASEGYIHRLSKFLDFFDQDCTLHNAEILRGNVGTSM